MCSIFQLSLTPQRARRKECFLLLTYLTQFLQWKWGFHFSLWHQYNVYTLQTIEIISIWGYLSLILRCPKPCSSSIHWTTWLSFATSYPLIEIVVSYQFYLVLLPLRSCVIQRRVRKKSLLWPGLFSKSKRNSLLPCHLCFIGLKLRVYY